MENKNNSSKITSLAIAFFISLLLWVYTVAETDPMTYKKFDDIPIEFINTQKIEENGLIIDFDLDKLVSIRVYGKNMLVSNIDKENIYAYVDFSTVSAVGEYSLTVEIDGLTEGVVVIDQTPRMFDFKVDTIGESSLNSPVITQSGTIASGHAVLSMTSDVDTVYVSGPSSILEQAHQVIGKVDITGKSESFNTTVPLVVIDKNGEELTDLTISSEKANVRVEIGVTKTVPVNVLTKGSVETGYNVGDIRSLTKEVKIAGSEEIISEIEQINTVAIDIDSATSSISQKVNLNIPSGVSLLDDSNKQVQVVIAVDKNNEKTIIISSYSFNGLGGNLTATVYDDILSVVLQGEDSLLSQIDESFLTGNIDVTGLGVGTYTLDVTITTKELPEGVTIKSLSKEEVKVNIVENE